jgi:F-box and WD-40 domain protein 5
MSLENLNHNEKEEILFDNSEWVYLPENVLLQILFYLSPREILNVGICCKRYNRISKDDYLWRKFFQRDFKVEKNIQLKPGESLFPLNYNNFQ